MATMQALIESYDIGPNRARIVIRDELQKFNIDEVRLILNQLETLPNTRGSNNPCGPLFNRWTGLPIWMRATLWSLISMGAAFMLPVQIGAAIVLVCKGEFKAIWKELPAPDIEFWNWRKNMVYFIKTPLRLVRESIEKGQALCVNRAGTFRIMEEGYAVMSHVWGETMGWQTPDVWGAVDLSVRKMGIPRQHFLRFFDKCGEEWLWVDLIAMPEVLEDMAPAEKEEIERLKVGVINCVGNIYMKADKIVVIDTTLLRLITRSPVDVAVALCLSFWMTRLWTYTETRMAKKVCLKTKDYSFDLDEIIEFLDQTVQNDEHRWYGLLTRLLPLRDHIFWRLGCKTLLESAYFGCQNRYTEVPLDEARVLFPLLGLQWVYGWKLHDGLKKIVEKHPKDVEQLGKWCHYRRIEFDVSLEGNGEHTNSTET